jgi:amidase
MSLKLLVPVLMITLALPVATSMVEAQETTLDAASIAQMAADMDAGRVTSEQLVQRYLARIAAYDRKGPAIHAVISLNALALSEARALDAERKAKGRRSPLHGIPLVLKDNFDTRDLPTTAGSVLLEGHQPSRDAAVVQQLRNAGAIILAKVNLSEFASGGTFSSLGGQTLNPHALAYSPGGSSGGTGAAVAAAFAQFGLGTDTGGSIRGPATVNGIVALKPTLGLLSRSGIVPLALSFDTGGPMTRSVSDLALVLGLMTAVDLSDSSTLVSSRRALTDYTPHLKADALRGARIGVLRDFVGYDTDVDWVVDASLDVMRRQGAVVVDVRIPAWVLAAKDAWYTAVRFPEFPVQLAEYLRTTGNAFPKSLDELVARARERSSLGANGNGPNPSRWMRFVAEQRSGSLNDVRYRSVKEHALPLLQQLITGLMDELQLDALVYPTQPVKPERLDVASGTNAPDPMNLANLTGFPDLIVPAGFSGNRLPIGLSFLGRAWSEPRLIELAYGFEQATRARRLPVTTPALAGDVLPGRRP